MRLSLRRARQLLMRTRLGRWLLIGFYETYLDQFARVAEAADNYNLRGGSRRASLRYRLHRCIHRLEKGLSLHPRRAGFGRDNFIELVQLMNQWRALVPEPHPTFSWGQHTAATYFEVLDADIEKADPAERDRLQALKSELGALWAPLAAPAGEERMKTPLQWMDVRRIVDPGTFANLLEARVSIRRWLEDPVPRAAIEKALQHGLRAPSACNRQPFGVVAIEDREKIKQAVELLTGGGGFADRAPLLLALTSDYGAYGGHEQRNLAYIDGGLAAMAFLLSLTAQGYASVPMNWSVDVDRDLKMRRLLGIGDTQVILFLVGVGIAHPDALVPASVRRPASESLIWI
jgi:nitroreductase